MAQDLDYKFAGTPGAAFPSSDGTWSLLAGSATYQDAGIGGLVAVRFPAGAAGVLGHTLAASSNQRAVSFLCRLSGAVTTAGDLWQWRTASNVGGAQFVPGGTNGYGLLRITSATAGSLDTSTTDLPAPGTWFEVVVRVNGTSREGDFYSDHVRTALVAALSGTSTSQTITSERIGALTSTGFGAGVTLDIAWVQTFTTAAEAKPPPARVYPAVLTRTTADTLGMTDQITAVWQRFATINDSLGIVDLPGPETRDITETIGDALGLTDRIDTVPTTGLVARWSADSLLQAGAVEGDPVAAWTETEGGLVAAQDTVAAQPTFRAAVPGFNGHAGVEFDGVADFLRLAGAGLNLGRNAGSLAVVIVYQLATPVPTTGPRTMLAASTGVNSAQHRWALYAQAATSLAAQVGGRRLDADSLQSISGTTHTGGYVGIQMGRFNWSAGELSLFEDGALAKSSLAFQTPGVTSDTASVAAAIGSRASGTGEFFSGRIADILVYTDLSPSRRQAVNAYLGNRYGITVVAEPSAGSASGDITWSANDAIGVTTMRGTAAGDITWGGAAAGEAPRAGTASGFVVFGAKLLDLDPGNPDMYLVGDLVPDPENPGLYLTYRLVPDPDDPDLYLPMASPLVVGVATAAGDAAGAVDFGGAAAGGRAPLGDAAGAVQFDGAAAGARVAAGAAAGQVTWAAAGTGARAAAGAGAGSVTFAGAAAGGRSPLGTAAGDITWAGSAAGGRQSGGSTGGAVTWAGSVTGAKAVTGSASGAVTWDGSTAAAARISVGTATGAATWAGSAAGVAPEVDVNQGFAGGGVGWAATAIGAITPLGAATGSVGFAGSAAGAVATSGAAAGGVSFSGGAAGDRPGAAQVTGAVTWAGSAAGGAALLGSAAGGVTWGGDAAGATLNTGDVTGAVTWAAEAAAGRESLGAGSGTVTWSGGGVGEFPAGGDSVGAVTWAGDTFSDVTHEGDAAGAALWGGAAQGRVGRVGAAAGDITWDTAAAGSADYQGDAAGGVAWAGLAISGVVTIGTAGGTVGWDGAVAGASRYLGVAGGTVTWDGGGTGAIEPLGTGVGGVGWDGGGAGLYDPLAEATGVVTFSGGGRGELTILGWPLRIKGPKRVGFTVSGPR